MEDRLCRPLQASALCLYRLAIIYLLAIGASSAPLHQFDNTQPLRSQESSGGKPFGSGYFGVWSEDAHGLPTYLYTAHQTTDPVCHANNTDPTLRDPTDQTFHIGNDRLVALASNYGYLEIRQDEGGPKILTDFSPQDNQFGAAIGMLIDQEGKIEASTFYEGTQGSGSIGDSTLLTSQWGKLTTDFSKNTSQLPLEFDRVYGVGYVEKAVRTQRVDITQRVTVPYGDDGVVVSSATIRNRCNDTVTLRYVEVWSGLMKHLDMLSGMLAPMSPPSPFADKREFVNTHYEYTFDTHSVDDNTAGGSRRGDGDFRFATLSRQFIGLTDSDNTEYGRAQQWLKQQAETNPWIGPVQDTFPEGASLWDEHPPTSFVAPLSVGDGGEEVRFGSNCDKFLGRGGIWDPTGAPHHVDDYDEQSISPKSSCFLVERQVSLPPMGEKEVSLLWGYVKPNNNDDDNKDMRRRSREGESPDAIDDVTFDKVKKLIRKYQHKSPNDVHDDTAKEWLRESASFRTGKGSSWVSREVAWNYFYTRAQFTFDDYFGEYVLDQGTRYRYDIGYEAAHRDPLQHLLPIIPTRPDLAKSVLRLSLKQIQPVDRPPYLPPWTNIPWALQGHGLLAPLALRPSDLEVYLLYAASEYVLITRDFGFLREKLPIYGDVKAKSRLFSVHRLLVRCYNYLMYHTGVGVHGLVRLGSSDWSDTITFDRAPNSTYNSTNFWAIEREGESVLTSAMVAYVSQRFRAVLSAFGDEEMAETVGLFGDSQRLALRKHAFNGLWFNRAYFSHSLGWIGEVDDQLNLEPQSWAILSQVFPNNSNETQRMVQEVLSRVSDPSPIGSMQLEKGYNIDPSAPPGYQENGGVWPALNHPLVMALSTLDASLAWTEWKKNTLAMQSHVYPRIWGGTWSSADASNSILATPPHATPGEPTGPNFPVLCTHRHAWPLFSLYSVAGLSFDGDGLAVRVRDPSVLATTTGVGEGIVSENSSYSLSTAVASIQCSLEAVGDSLLFSSVKTTEKDDPMVGKDQEIVTGERVLSVEGQYHPLLNSADNPSVRITLPNHVTVDKRRLSVKGGQPTVVVESANGVGERGLRTDKSSSKMRWIWSEDTHTLTVPNSTEGVRWSIAVTYA